MTDRHEYKEGDWARVVASADDLKRYFIQDVNTNVNTNDLVRIVQMCSDSTVMAVLGNDPDWCYKSHDLTPAFQPGERYRVKDGVNLGDVFLDKDHYGHIGVVSRTEFVRGHLRIFLQHETAIDGCANYFYWPEHLEYVGPDEGEREMAPTEPTTLAAYKIQIRDAILAEREDEDLDICDEGLKKFFDKMGIPWEPDKNWSLTIDGAVDAENRDRIRDFIVGLGLGLSVWEQKND